MEEDEVLLLSREKKKEESRFRKEKMKVVFGMKLLWIYKDNLQYKAHIITYQFLDILMQNYTNFIQTSRKIGVTTLPSIGCLPVIITTFGYHINKYVEKINDIALDFNKKKLNHIELDKYVVWRQIGHP
ncbi:transmembrane protein, putative [Medicago truncatula]|uniref:Transmembrane protein, putative n=1 Tax=Medicago truncatula TaxID=3880 RepID=G7KA96_MEDTR|nr:transmembrane protein, putative [Medicago truncatula]